jgi:hypothetical protein
MQGELYDVLTLLTLVAARAIVAIGSDHDRLSSSDTNSVAAMFQLYRAGVLPRLKRAAAQPWLHTRWGASAAAPQRFAAHARRQLAAAAEGGAQPRLCLGVVEWRAQQGNGPACCMRRLGRNAA